MIKNRTNSPNRMATAYHEASHFAVAASFHSNPIKTVVVREDYNGGYVSWRVRLLNEQHATVLIAGAVAECIFSQDQSDLMRHISMDMQHLAEYIKFIPEHPLDGDIPTWAFDLAAAINKSYGYNEYSVLALIMDAYARITKLEWMVTQMANEFGSGRRQMFSSTTAKWSAVMYQEYRR